MGTSDSKQDLVFRSALVLQRPILDPYLAVGREAFYHEMAGQKVERFRGGEGSFTLKSPGATNFFFLKCI